MVEESKYSDVMKKLFNKEPLMTKEDDEDFGNSNKCWICDNVIVSAHRDCNINVKLNPKIPVVFYNLKIMIHILWKNKGNSILK